jgi:hypothetical protein
MADIILALLVGALVGFVARRYGSTINPRIRWAGVGLGVILMLAPLILGTTGHIHFTARPIGAIIVLFCLLSA